MAMNKEQIRKETIALMDEMFEGKIKGEHREAMKDGINGVLDEVALLVGKHSANPTMSLTELLSHLPQERIDLIRHSFDIQTFYPSVDKEEKFCEFLRDGVPVWPKIQIDTEEGLRSANIATVATILVECVCFILNLVGASPPQKAILAAVNVATKWLDKSTSATSELTSPIESMKEAFRNHDFTKLATLIVGLIIKLFKDFRSHFWEIVKTLMSNMSWFDWVLFAAKLAAFVLAMIASGGVAVVARIVKIIIDAASFLLKLKKL